MMEKDTGRMIEATLSSSADSRIKVNLCVMFALDEISCHFAVASYIVLFLFL